MNEVETCSVCGTALDPARGGGLCAACLLGDALPETSGESEGGILGSIGGLDLLEVIARGGMGVVYRARQYQPLREVALKALPGADLMGREARERFRIEIEAMASLDHPAILPVHESGEDDGTPYFTMKLASGGSLAARIGTFSGKWREIAGLMVRIAGAVQFAHEHGVLHRDLKPGNVLFDEGGQAFVSDFGLAKLIGRESDLTRSIAMLGTPHYLAPEIAAKSASVASPASDVWAMGAILYELLALRPPFAADSVPALLRSIVEDEPAALAPAVPRDLRVIALKALSKDPARRYPSAAAFGEDLSRWLRGEPILARPAHPVGRLWTRLRKRPALLVFCGLVLPALAGFAWMAQGRQREQVLSEQRASAMKEETRARLIDRARSGRKDKQAGWRDGGLELLRQAGAIRTDADVVNESIAHLAGFDFAAEPVPVEGGVIYRNPPADLVALRKVIVGRNLGEGASFNCSPCGRWAIASGGETELAVLIDRRGPSIAGEWKLIERALFRNDGGKLLLLQMGEAESGSDPPLYRIRVVGLPSVTEEAVIDRKRGAIDSWAFSPVAGQTCFAIASAGEVGIWDWSRRELLGQFPCAKRSSHLNWCGERVVVIDEEGKVAIRDSYDENGMVQTIASSARIVSLAMTDDGLHLVTNDSANETALWQADTRRLLSRINRVRSNLAGPSMHLDGRAPQVLEWTGETATGHRISPPEVLRTLSYLPMGLPDSGRCDFSPCGKFLSITRPDKVVIIDFATGACVADMPVRDAWVCYFSADSRHLILGEKKRLSLHALEVSGGRLAIRHIADLRTNAKGFASYPSMSCGRRWLSLPESGTLVSVLDCDGFSEWTEYPTNGPAKVSFVSSDGKWVIAGIRGTDAVDLRLWDRARPLEPRVLREGSSSPKFSPDSRWLVEKDIGNAHVTVYDTATWQKVYHTEPVDEEWPGSLDWSSDGKLLVIGTAGGKLRLIEAGTWRTIAYLEGPSGGGGQVIFHPGGVQVVDVGHEIMEVWDLHELAGRLHAMGLPLDLPPSVGLPPVPPEFSGPLQPVARPPASLLPLTSGGR